MENNTEEKSMNLFEKFIKGIADAVKVPIKRRAVRVMYISAYNDLLKQKLEAQTRRFKQQEKLEDMDMNEFLKCGNEIRECNNAIEDLKEGFLETFGEELPEDV